MRHGRIRSRRSRPSSRRARHPGRHPFFVTSSRTARRAEPGSRRAATQEPLDPRPAFAGAGFPAGMTAKRMWRTFAPCSVIAVGMRRRAGPSSWTASLLLTLSRTARRAEPESRREPRKHHWIPGSRCARPGMTATSKTAPPLPHSCSCPPLAGALSYALPGASPLLTSSRMARSAGPGPEAPPRLGLLHLAMTSGPLQCSTCRGVRMCGVGATKVRRVRPRHR